MNRTEKLLARLADVSDPRGPNYSPQETKDLQDDARRLLATGGGDGHASR